jgi:hypothetical protein
MSTSKEKKIDTAIVVAIIGLCGTICVGLLNSPLLVKFIMDRASLTQTVTPITAGTPLEITATPAITGTPFIDTATPAVLTTLTATVDIVTPTATTPRPTRTRTPATATLGAPQVLQQVFKADFENNFASGFGFTFGDWKILKDKTNHLLQGDSVGSVPPAAVAYFGPSDFTDGAVEFRVKFPILSSNLYFEFRQDETNGSYALHVDPTNKVIALGANMLADKKRQFSEIGSGARQAFTFQKDIWYKIRVEIKGEKMVVSIDDNLILLASDSHLVHGRLRFTLDPNSIVDFDETNVWIYQP